MFITPNSQLFITSNNVKSKDRHSYMSKIDNLKDINLNNLNYNNKSLINFTGYKTSFKDTLDKNYFNLPIDKNTGEVFKPDIYQVAAAENLYKGNDVVVAAPTGTGKTAIAHYIITKNLNENKKTFYTAPLKALSNDKIREFKNIYGEDNVGLLTGDRKVNSDAPIVIMTTEVYRNMLMQEKLNSHNPILNGLKTVIFDELHYLNDDDRGTVWEQSILFTNPKTQILGLSGTMKNAGDITDWIASTKGQNTSEKVCPDENYHALNMDKPHTVLIDVPPENRHVPLKFDIIKINQKQKEKTNVHKKLKKQKSVNPDKMSAQSVDFINITYKLQNEDKLPAIFFIFSKKKSKELLNEMKINAPQLTTKDEQKEILNTLEDYEKKGIYLGEKLDREALLKGYVIHNAGMIPEQKELVEKLFQKKLVKVAFATETLSAGINMPARTTVISSTIKPVSKKSNSEGRRPLSPNEFHQMAGRAGRRGIDTVGYVYCIACNDKQQKDFNNLINTKSNDIKSHLNTDFSFVANIDKNYNSKDFLSEFFEKSFYAYDKDAKIREQNSQKLKDDFYKKEKILKDTGFITKENKVTEKGELLTKINGYEQIPIIDAIYNKDLKNLNAQQLAGYVAGLANLASEEPKYSFDDRIDFTDEVLENKAYDLSEKINDYQYDVYEKLDQNIFLNKNTMKHVYRWADLNSKNEDSTDNWHNMLIGEDAFNISDEGLLFKEIVMTTDLLKQIQEISEVGSQNTLNAADKRYYKNLRSTAQEAIDLINRKPAKQDE